MLKPQSEFVVQAPWRLALASSRLQRPRRIAVVGASALVKEKILRMRQARIQHTSLEAAGSVLKR